MKITRLVVGCLLAVVGLAVSMQVLPSMSTSSATTLPAVAPKTSANVAAQASANGSNDGGSKIIGLPWSGEALGRIVVKDYTSVAVMFVAEETSQITSINPSFIGSTSPWPANANEDTNYSAGNGGTIKLDIYADDGSASHIPTGPSLGGFVWNEPMRNGQWLGVPGAVGYGYSAAINLSNPVPVVGGRRYHLVWTNPNPQASTNWYGVNFETTRWKQFSTGATQDVSVMPASRFDVKYRATGGSYVTSGRWKSCTSQSPGNYCYHYGFFFTPIVSVNYANGRGQGNAYEGFRLDPQELAPNVTGANKIRQIMKVDSDTTIDSAVFSAIPYATGVARVSLKRYLDDSLVVSKDVPYSLAPALLRTDIGCNVAPNPPPYSCGTNSIRLTASFGTPVVLSPGFYYLEFASVSGSYNVTIAEPNYEFRPQTYDIEGSAGKWDGSAWTPVGGGGWDVFAYLRPPGLPKTDAVSVPPVTVSRSTKIPALTVDKLCAGGTRYQVGTKSVELVGTPGSIGPRIVNWTNPVTALKLAPSPNLRKLSSVTLRYRYFAESAALRTGYRVPLANVTNFEQRGLKFPATKSWSTVTQRWSPQPAGATEFSISWDVDGYSTLHISYIDLCPAA